MFSDFFKSDKLYYKKISEKLSNNEIIFGLVDEKIIIACNPNVEISTIEESFRKLKKLIESLTPAELTSHESNKQQVTYQKTYTVDLNSMGRVICKIVFNGLAKLIGNTKILDSIFDDIRLAILTGDNIKKFIFWMNNFEIDIKSILPEVVVIGEYSHILNITEEKGILMGYLLLYGHSLFCVQFNLSPHDFSDLKLEDFYIYICDWQNKEEYNLMHKLGKESY